MQRNTIKKLLIYILFVYFCMTLVSCNSPAKLPADADPETDPGPAQESEKAIQYYQEFLEKEDLYTLTATKQYPRGDSRAVYAFGDCTGDGIPELHLDGGGVYHIYTLQEEQVVSLYEYEGSQIIPLKNGAFIRCSRFDTSPSSCTSEQPPPAKSDPFAEMGRAESSRDYYFYYRLNPEGIEIQSDAMTFSVSYKGFAPDIEIDYEINNTECPKEEWESQFAPYQKMLEDDTLHLSMEYVFPKKEWDYLNALEEGNGVLGDTDNTEEWASYQRILSGDFSFVNDIDSRSHLISQYLSSLDENTGRSCWKYILQDFNGDGVRELLIRYRPEIEDYASLYNTARGIACFSYKNGKVTWWESDVSHEEKVPLKDGRFIYRSAYGVTDTIIVGRNDSEFLFNPEKIYEKLIVSYTEGYHDREWYEENIFGKSNWELYTFCERVYDFPSDITEEGYYYFTQNLEGRLAAGDLIRLTDTEWQTIQESLEELLIPDVEWKPASVFMPAPRWEQLSYG